MPGMGPSTYGNFVQAAFQTTAGIRQGSVESPRLFGALIVLVLSERETEFGWQNYPSTYPDMHVTQAAYMDDLYLWEGRVEDLELKIQQLLKNLHKWGLELNLKKCSLYLSPSIKVGPLFGSMGSSSHLNLT